MPLVAEGNGKLVVAVGSQAGRGASLARHEPNIETTLACRGKGNLLSIRTPDGIGIVGRIGG